MFITKMIFLHSTITKEISNANLIFNEKEINSIESLNFEKGKNAN